MITSFLSASNAEPAWCRYMRGPKDHHRRSQLGVPKKSRHQAASVGPVKRNKVATKTPGTRGKKRNLW